MSEEKLHWNWSTGKSGKEARLSFSIIYLDWNGHVVACSQCEIGEDFSSPHESGNPVNLDMDGLCPQKRLRLSHPQTVKWRQRNGLH